LQGELWMLAIPFVALLTRLDWGLLVILWIVAASLFYLVVFLSAVDPPEVDAEKRITVDELRSVVHHLLAQPVDDLRVEDKTEAIRGFLVDLERKGRAPWWSRALTVLMGNLLMFAGVASVAALFPGIAWIWWLLLGMILGVVVALLLCLVYRGVRWLVRPAGQQAPLQSTLGEQAGSPTADD
jgi:hypothetical protein